MDPTVKSIEIDQIFVDEGFNCRQKIAPIDVISLAKDIAINGLLQPVIVSEQSEETRDSTGKPYRLIAGFRRFKAHMVNAATTILCSVHPAGVLPEVEARYLNLSENLNREDLNILQEAMALNELYLLGVTEHEAMKRLGRSRGWIQVRFMLLKLPQEIQREVASGIVNQTQIRGLYSIHKKGTTEELHLAVKAIKSAKSKGERVPSVPIPNARKGESKRHRARQEVFEMMVHIQGTLGNNFGTRCLAWAAGEITGDELITDIQAQAYAANIPYAKPDWS